MQDREIAVINRKATLKRTAELYFESLRKNNFSTIPFSDAIILRVPIAPGGSHNSMQGKQKVFEQWWKPLEPALQGVTINIIDHYYNEMLTEIVTKADITIATTGITLRTADRFIVSEAGEITEQESHFDASPVKSYIHHICLRSTNFENTKDFYHNKLGFPVAIDTAALIIFVAGNVFIAFKKAEPRNKDYALFSPFEVGLDHIAITCETKEELQQFTKKLDDAGVQNTGIKLDETLQKLYVAFKDPDRIAWEFYMK